jgi:hypothetical protein
MFAGSFLRRECLLDSALSAKLLTFLIDVRTFFSENPDA